YIEEAAAFLKPGILPGLYHGVRFVRKETTCLQNLLEIGVERFNIGSQLRRLKRGLIPEVVEDAIPHFLAPALEQNQIGTCFLAQIFYLQLTVRCHSR